MFLFDWITQRVADAVERGFKLALEREPTMQPSPSPPQLSVAAEALTGPEPTNGHKARRLASR